MQKKKPRAGKVILFFIIATFILYYIYLHQVVPMPLLIFAIGLSIIILLSIFWLMPSEDKEYTVIPIWKGKGGKYGR